MKIAIVGTGKMGQVIEGIATSRGHEIVLRANSKHPLSVDKLQESEADVAIEFTQPESAVKNIFTCFDAGVPVVTGTTGWFNRFNEVKGRCEQEQQCLFHASNFSIGVNLFFEVNKQLARLMNDHDAYEPEILEIHHTEKKDAPSGTAITTAEGILYELQRKDSWINDTEGQDSELCIESQRLPGVPGTHRVTYQSADDVLVLEHEAKGRNGFALGAVKAAEWARDKRGVFTMKDMLGIGQD